MIRGNFGRVNKTKMEKKIYLETGKRHHVAREP